MKSADQSSEILALSISSTQTVRITQNATSVCRLLIKFSIDGFHYTVESVDRM